MKSKKVIHLYYEDDHDSYLVDMIDAIRDEMSHKEGANVDFKKATKRLIYKGIEAYEGEK